MTKNDEYPTPEAPTPYDIWKESGDGNKLAPPYQDERLWKVVEHHFPEITRDTPVYENITAELAVEAADDMIRLCCARGAAWDEQSFGEDGQPVILYGQKQGGVAQLRQAIKAIDDRDPELWQQATALIPYRTWLQIGKTKRKMEKDLEIAIIDTLGDVAIKALGPTPESLQEHPELWNLERRILDNVLMVFSEGGRPSQVYKDDAVRECVELWELFSGKTATQPHYKTGSSERSGEMMEFVADAVAVYNGYGMRGALPKNSGASLQRIMNPPKE